MNATQILGVAGWSGLERQKKMQKLRNSEFDEHQTLKGAGIERGGFFNRKIRFLFHSFTGTWIPLHDAIRVAKDYLVYDTLKPILEYRPSGEDPPEAPKEILRLLRSGRPRESTTVHEGRRFTSQASSLTTFIESSSRASSSKPKPESSRSPSPALSSPLSSPPPSPAVHMMRPRRAAGKRPRSMSTSTAVIRTYPARNARELPTRSQRSGLLKADKDDHGMHIHCFHASLFPKKSGPDFLPNKRSRLSEPAPSKVEPEPSETSLTPPPKLSSRPRNGLADFGRSRGYNL